MLFTVLGVIALFLRERNINTTVSGQDERLDRQEGLVTVPTVTKSDGREIGDRCEESSLHLEEQINVQTEEPSLEEPVDGQSEEQSLVEPDSVYGEEQPLVEPDISAEPGCSRDPPPNVVSAEPGCSHDDPPNVVSAEPGCSHDDPPNVVSAEPGCSHYPPPNVFFAKPGCKDGVAQGATCQTEGAVPPQPEELKDEDTHIIEINSKSYEIGAKLGKGGFGTVFAGTRLQDGLQVAVKIADFKIKRFIHVDDFDKLLPSEIALHFLATKGPKVKQIVELLDWKVEENCYFLVLERPIPCVSVGEFIRKHRGNIAEKVLRKIMFHTTIAAHICCKRGVFHRDIKPDNLLMNPQTYEVKLTDFGCGERLTETCYREYCGTFQFSPPEFQKTGYYFGEPATVWSLGILQYLLMFKNLPDNRDLRKMTFRNLQKYGWSEECSDFIRCCLQNNYSFRHKLHALRAHAWFKVIHTL
ncbi:serine/threonine-protein kinase pim-3-like [Danio aesculapii]|uniref:serine/threonine-protein kinase pim-3-like n=1 Tax=Danio aesculapii TaxID=1142201 RepID=UPI0024BFBE91|nr:serine/threonine-protein kinase pim-3-like [Danio aesculapii]